MNAQTLSVAFRKIVRSWLDLKRLDLIDKANAAETDPNICHSHDYCDPNEAMIGALESFGVEWDGQDEAQAKLINEAWDIAKREGFSN